MGGQGGGEVGGGGTGIESKVGDREVECGGG